MHRYMLSHCACMGDAGSILACIISCSQMQINANKYKYMQLTLCQIKYNKLYNNILLTIMKKKVCTHMNTRFMLVWDRYVKQWEIFLDN